MRFSIALIAAVAPYLASALPFKRAAAGDLTVLKFADALEQLESNFYSQALKKFTMSDFQSAGFSAPASAIQQLTAIGGDEATHSSVLQDAIKANGGQPISGCSFDFSSALVDVPTMAATARVVENVGVGAYLGAAHLVSDPQLLTAAGSILTTEARHQTMLNLLGGGTAIPQAFDIALLPPQVLAIASPFISGCDLGITPNPTLTVTNTGPVMAGTQLQFNSTALNGSMSTANMTCQMMVGGQAFSIALPFDQCVVPQGINGPVAIFITSDPQPLLSDIIEQANNSIVAGPTMAFIDSQPDMLAQSIRQSSSSGGSSNSSMGSSMSSSMGSSNGSSMGSMGSGNSSSDNSGAGGSSSSASCAAGSGSNGTYVDVVSAPGGFNNYVGPSADGHLCVNGWTNVPGAAGSNSTSSNSTTPSSSSDSASATPSSSSDPSSSSTSLDSSSATPSASSGP